MNVKGRRSARNYKNVRTVRVECFHSTNEGNKWLLEVKLNRRHIVATDANQKDKNTFINIGAVLKVLRSMKCAVGAVFTLV